MPEVFISAFFVMLILCGAFYILNKVEKPRNYKFTIGNARSGNWVVAGMDLISHKDGILEWAYDEAHADNIMKEMKNSGEFISLRKYKVDYLKD